MPEPARTGTGDLHGGAARWPGIFFHETKDGRGVGETRAAHMTGIDSFSYIFRVPFLLQCHKAQADADAQTQKSSSEFPQGFAVCLVRSASGTRDFFPFGVTNASDPIGRKVAYGVRSEPATPPSATPCRPRTCPTVLIKPHRTATIAILDRREQVRHARLSTNDVSDDAPHGCDGGEEEARRRWRRRGRASTSTRSAPPPPPRPRARILRQPGHRRHVLQVLPRPRRRHRREEGDAGRFQDERRLPSAGEEGQDRHVRRNPHRAVPDKIAKL